MPVVDHGLFAPRRGAAKVGRAARDTIGRINLADASIAVTKVFCSWFPTIVIRFVTASPGRAALQKKAGASANDQTLTIHLDAQTKMLFEQGGMLHNYQAQLRPHAVRSEFTLPRADVSAWIEALMDNDSADINISVRSPQGSFHQVGTIPADPDSRQAGFVIYSAIKPFYLFDDQIGRLEKALGATDAQ